MDKSLDISIDASWVGLQACLLKVCPHLHSPSSSEISVHNRHNGFRLHSLSATRLLLEGLMLHDQGMPGIDQRQHDLCKAMTADSFRHQLTILSESMQTGEF